MKREDHRWAPVPAVLALAPPMPRVAPPEPGRAWMIGWRGPYGAQGD